MLHNWKVPRSECDGGLLFFHDMGFGVDTKVFKKITEQEILDMWCNQCAKDVTQCTKYDLFSTIVKNEQDKQGNV